MSLTSQAIINQEMNDWHSKFSFLTIPDSESQISSNFHSIIPEKSDFVDLSTIVEAISNRMSIDILREISSTSSSDKNRIAQTAAAQRTALKYSISSEIVSSKPNAAYYANPSVIRISPQKATKSKITNRKVKVK